MKSSYIARLVLGLTCISFVTSVRADPSDYLRLPTVHEGEKEVDFKSGAQRNRDGTSDTATSLGLGMGVTSWWFTEVYAKMKRHPGESNDLDAWEWENRFQLTETGRYPADLGFLFEVERPKDRSEGYELLYGPLLQKEWDRIQGNLNLLFEQHIRAAAPAVTEMRYQMQLKYRQMPQFEWGVQAFGAFGKWNDWNRSSSQEHKLGPALYGRFKTGAGQAFRWNAALLFGTTNTTPSKTLRVQAEYEFY
ncbi:MAG: hypothetical protein WCJ69_08570 [Betaproteobacteria bacterium]|jgi:hypothetical protein